MTAPRGDLVGRPVSFALWWGLPLAIGAVNLSWMHLPFRVEAAVCAVLFVWMATGCLLNAMRCHRLHCYISAPVFLIGAIFAAVAATGIVSVSQNTFHDAVALTLVLALLSFVPEMTWKRYL